MAHRDSKLTTSNEYSRLGMVLIHDSRMRLMSNYNRLPIIFENIAQHVIN